MINFAFNGFTLMGGAIVFSLLLAGTFLMYLFTQVHRITMDRHAAGMKGRALELVILNIMIAILAIPALILMVWGAWFTKIPYVVTAYHSNFGEWLFFVSLRFSGFIVLFGLGGYPALRDVRSAFSALEKRLKSWRQKPGNIAI